MVADDPRTERPCLPAFLCSLLVPGLGQAANGEPYRAVGILSATGIILGCAWGIGRLLGVGPAILFLIVALLPWWTIQSYDAWLPPPSNGSRSFKQTVQTVWQQAHDIRYLGLLFLFTAATDLYIILANPSYALTLFCAKPTGLWGLLAKAQSPTLHLLIGYGFMRLHRWSLLLYLAYATFGFMNASANFACFGYGRVRTVFLLTLLAFTAYVLWRARCFRPPHAEPRQL